MRTLRTAFGLFLTSVVWFTPAPSNAGERSDNDRGDWRPTAAELVKYLNENARNIPGLRCGDATLECRVNTEVFAATARLDCDRPRHFRLAGKVIGQPLFDVGSNESEYWYWFTKADPPYVFHCRHEALARGDVRMPLCFRPDIVHLALGMTHRDPAAKYEVRIRGAVAELIEAARFPREEPVQKVTLFKCKAMKAGEKQPRVVGHVLRDAKGNDIYRITVSEVVLDTSSGAVLPQRIEIEWPSEKIKLTLKLGEIEVVRPDPRQARQLYSRNNLSSQKGFDIAAGKADAPPDAAPPERFDRSQLRYSGRSFEEWQRELLTELNPKQRIVALKALLEFTTNGYAAEVTATVLHMMGGYSGLALTYEEFRPIELGVIAVIDAAGEEARTGMLKALRTENRNRQLFVLSQWKRNGWGVDEAIAPLLQRLALGKDEEVQQQVNGLLIYYLDQKEATQILEKVVRERITVVQALGGLDPNAGSQRLLELAQTNGTPEVRKAASEVLASRYSKRGADKKAE